MRKNVRFWYLRYSVLKLIHQNNGDVHECPLIPYRRLPKDGETNEHIARGCHFPTLGELNTKDLLYMLAEIVIIEQDLQECETADSKSQEGDKQNYAVS